MEEIYKEHGYENRDDYLASMAEEYSVSEALVFSLASLLGPEEDFDGLISSLECHVD